eukprot:1443007-Pyramimonas_sp.AAC.2
MCHSGGWPGQVLWQGRRASARPPLQRRWRGHAELAPAAPAAAGPGSVREHDGADEWVHGPGAGAGGHEQPQRDPGPGSSSSRPRALTSPRPRQPRAHHPQHGRWLRL